MKKPIGMNDRITMSFTLFEWTRLRISLHVAGFSLKESDEISSRTLIEFYKKIGNNLSKLDFSANERLVDEINKKVKEKQA